ncbi:hypothetical protein K9U40_05540 [Xanthobacter autotrophicus]|uniref:DUF6152 family protein n=1 Tax=Xanthobacter TaxID=279 RepID=UPI0024AA077E|nr:DUF6152 family protein [Xanthobacter autotrophicus]MDI4663790.1 hypothetical protein [Xanthobacter autotrophicus]
MPNDPPPARLPSAGVSTDVRRTGPRRLGPMALAALLISAGTAAAHHGWGSYDTAKAFTMTGPVIHMEWANPHAHLSMQHEGATWEATLAPISRMQARGLSADMLKPGTTVSVYGYPSTRTPNEMRAERITVDGKTIELR